MSIEPTKQKTHDERRWHNRFPIFALVIALAATCIAANAVTRPLTVQGRIVVVDEAGKPRVALEQSGDVDIRGRLVVRGQDFATPPVGAVLPFFGKPESLPPGWTLCDGKALNEENGFTRDKVASEWWNQKVPKLTGHMLRGTAAGEKPGSPGGEDKIAEHVTRAQTGMHSHTIIDPKRELEGYTEKIALRGIEWLTNKTDPFSVQDNDGHRDGSHHLDVEGDGGGEGQHRHELGGRGHAKSAGKLATVSDTKGHQHTIDAVPFIPSYVACHFIIRIK